jgi:hypothetical protein
MRGYSRPGNSALKRKWERNEPLLSISPERMGRPAWYCLPSKAIRCWLGRYHLLDAKGVVDRIVDIEKLVREPGLSDPRRSKNSLT